MDGVIHTVKNRSKLTILLIVWRNGHWEDQLSLSSCEHSGGAAPTHICTASRTSVCADAFLYMRDLTYPSNPSHRNSTKLILTYPA